MGSKSQAPKAPQVPGLEVLKPTSGPANTFTSQYGKGLEASPDPLQGPLPSGGQSGTSLGGIPGMEQPRRTGNSDPIAMEEYRKRQIASGSMPDESLGFKGPNPSLAQAEMERRALVNQLRGGGGTFGLWGRPNPGLGWRPPSQATVDWRQASTRYGRYAPRRRGY